MAEPLTPEVLVYGFTSAGDPRISPDGSSIIYTVSTVDKEAKKGSSQLWRCGLDGGDRRQLTHTGTRNGSGRWSPDGASIAFVSDRVKQAGIFVMPADQPGEARELTHHGTAITDPVWSPDGSQIAYSAEFDPENPEEKEPEEDAAPPVRVTRRIDYKQDGRRYLGDKRTQVFVVDVASGERRMVTHEPVDHYFPQWSPDGKTLAVDIPNRNGMHSQLALVDVASGETKRITPEDGSVGVWSWSPDGTRIFYAGDLEQSWQSDFFVYDVAAGQATRITDDLPVVPMGGFPGVMGPSIPVWLDEQTILFNAVRAGASGLYTINLQDRELEKLYGDEATLSGLSIDDARRHIVQGYTSFAAAGEISVYDTQSRHADVVTDYSHPTLEAHPPARWERFEVPRGKYSIEAWLMKPPDFDPAKKYPVILDIHGGPNGFYGYTFNPIQQLLATNGFLLVFSNPRGSSSYGREFTQQVIGDWGGEDFKDLMAVIDKVLELPYANADKTGIFGYSYGGYMTSWTIGQTGRFQACVCGAPCFDLESFYGTSDIGHSFGKLQFGAAPHEGKEWYAQHSPSNFAHRATTPTLIIHGEADERCPIGQGEQMFVALKKAGCEVEFARYPGGAHGFVRMGPPEHRVDVLGRILGWFKDHLGEPV
ncbi:MAG TPA: S9 family peptidase [Thermomicrobiaceae bacterium]|nr:S9 family peptidase [Thermomicrobiaceae bacterium]